MAPGVGWSCSKILHDFSSWIKVFWQRVGPPAILAAAVKDPFQLMSQTTCLKELLSNAVHKWRGGRDEATVIKEESWLQHKPVYIFHAKCSS